MMQPNAEHGKRCSILSVSRDGDGIEGSAPWTYCFAPGLRSSTMCSIILTSPERWRRRLACGRTASRPEYLPRARAMYSVRR
jgi:hypothetical protein